MSFGVKQAIDDYREEHGEEPTELTFARDSDTGIKILILYDATAPFETTLHNGLKVIVK